MKEFFKVAILILASLLQGCSSFTGIDSKYPEAWPPLNEAERECPSLNGVFTNLGEYSYAPYGGSPYLYFHFNFAAKPHLVTEIDSIRITSNEQKSIVVEAIYSGQPLVTTQLNKDDGDYSCSEGTIILATKSKTSADGFGAAKKYSTFYLRRASDGSLVGSEKSTTAATAMYIVPLVGSQTFWYRWPRQQYQ